jgi:predicted RNA binding protein YcfA (HicA-like mRNA interferase family)
MSGKIPVLKPQEVVNILVRFGFVKVRQKDSHQQFRHEDDRGTTVPFHKGSDISGSKLVCVCH